MDRSIAVTPSLNLTLDRVAAPPDESADAEPGRASTARQRLATDALGLLILLTLLAAYLLVRI